MRTNGLVLGLTAIAAGLAVAPAHASFPGANGKLASEYVEINRGGADDQAIQVFGLDGKVTASISPCSRPEFGSPSGTCPRNPSFSADGKRIAFDREGRLALAAPDGTGLLTLPRLTAEDSDPAFSPDGTKLVFTGRAGGGRNLYMVALDGSGLQQLTHAGGRLPSWSATGQIAYTAARRIWRLRPGSRRRERVANGSTPDWSPSGKSIVYEFAGNVYRVAIRRGARRRLVRRDGAQPAFSPDAKLIAFEREIPIGGGDSLGSSIYTVRARTGRRLRRIREGGETPIGSTYDFFSAVAWQPLP